jgi:hypothetical protein
MKDFTILGSKNENEVYVGTFIDEHRRIFIPAPSYKYTHSNLYMDICLFIFVSFKK